MRTTRSRFSFVAIFLLSSAVLIAQQSGPVVTDDQVNTRVESILQQMNLHEKVGQLNQLSAADWNKDPVSPDEHTKRGEAGSFLWTTDSKMIDRLQHVAMEQSRMKIPLLFGFDVIHGYRNMFPIPIAMAASWDPAVVEK